MNKMLFKTYLLVLMLGATAAPAGSGCVFVTLNSEQTLISEPIFSAVSLEGPRWNSLDDSKRVIVSTIGHKGRRNPYLFHDYDGKMVCLPAMNLSIHLKRDWSRALNTVNKSSAFIYKPSDVTGEDVVRKKNHIYRFSKSGETSWSTWQRSDHTLGPKQASAFVFITQPARSKSSKETKT